MSTGSKFRLVSWLLIGSALSLVLFAGTNVAYDISRQSELASAWDQGHHAAAAPTTTTASDPFQLSVQRPRLAVGQPLAKISIPAVGWHGIVLEGSDDRVLAGGPGHLLGTAYPGEADNVVISNHNTYSKEFGDIKAGAQVVLETDYGRFVYRVTGFKVINGTDSSVTAHTGKAQLTLTTCYPLWAGAFAKQRYVVLAELVTS